MKKFFIICSLVFAVNSFALSVDENNYDEEQMTDGLQDRYSEDNTEQRESPDISMAIESDEINPDYEQVDDTREESSPEAYEEPQEPSDY